MLIHERADDLGVDAEEFLDTHTSRQWTSYKARLLVKAAQGKVLDLQRAMRGKG